MGLIYKITNVINNKIYIGQTRRTLSNRISTHKSDLIKGSSAPLYNAIRKYGWDNFKWEIVQDNIQTLKELNELEQFYIIKFNSLVNNDLGYNVLKGGDVVEMPPSVRKKISNNTKGRIPWNKGIPRTEEEKRKMSEANKGQIVSEETKQKISVAVSGSNNPFYGKKHTEESKQKIREARLGTSVSEETRAKLSANRKGKIHTEETKNKMSEVAKENLRHNNFMGARDKIYKITKPDNTVEIIKNLNKYCRDNNLNRSCMSEVSMGRQKAHKGFKCEPIII